MDALQEILTKIKPTGLSDQEKDLADGLVDNIWNTDKDIVNHYWPNNPYGQTYLSSLKIRLTSKLVSSILFFKSDASYQAAYIECWREFAAIQVLKGVGARRGAVWLAERLLKKSIQYDLTEIVVSISDMLLFNAANIAGDRNKFNKYKKVNETYEAILREERNARKKLAEISINLTTSRSIDKELADQANNYSIELYKKLNQYNSFHFALYTFNLLIVHAELTQDQEKLLSTCNEALIFFNNKPYPIPQSVAFLFTFKTIPATLQTKDYAACYRAIQQSKEISDRGSYNKGVCLIYEAILGFHSNDPQLIRTSIKESTIYRKYSVITEQWKIIEAYANLLNIETGQNFRISKFLNQVPIFSKDKRGNNITILILQTLFYLRDGKKGKIIDRIEALKRYSHRYLRKDNTFRSNCFIHMLLCINKGNFHPAATQRYAKPFVDKLGSYQGGEIEIIQYERLWEEVIILLNKQSRIKEKISC